MCRVSSTSELQRKITNVGLEKKLHILHPRPGTQLLQLAQDKYSIWRLSREVPTKAVAGSFGKTLMRVGLGLECMLATGFS